MSDYYNRKKMWLGIQQRTEAVKYRQENAAVSEVPFSGTGTPTINRQFLEKRSSCELDETSKCNFLIYVLLNPA
jgi:hypothetical protein